MCGRYASSRRPEDLVEEFEVVADRTPAPLAADYNVAPTKEVYAVVERPPSKDSPEPPERQLRVFTWGLVPSWAKDPSIGNRMANVRSDTALEKGSFRAAMQKRRCLMPADVFYEWQDVPGQKRRKPYAVAIRDGEIFALGGLWEAWRAKESGEWLITCAILTTEPNELLEPIHDRMPVIVQEQDYAKWISPGTEAVEVHRMVQSYPDELMRTWEIGVLVNDPKTDDASILTPVSDS